LGFSIDSTDKSGGLYHQEILGQKAIGLSPLKGGSKKENPIKSMVSAIKNLLITEKVAMTTVIFLVTILGLMH
jgi:hypothetical protein